MPYPLHETLDVAGLFSPGVPGLGVFGVGLLVGAFVVAARGARRTSTPHLAVSHPLANALMSAEAKRFR